MTVEPLDASDVLPLWPEGPPTRIEDVPPEVEYEVRSGLAAGKTFLRNVSEPTLTVFTPAGAINRVGVIVAPGGGWTINAWTHEGLEVARWLTSLGYTTFVLKYRVQGSGADQDAFEARMAAVDATLAAGLSAGKLPRRMDELIATEGYRQARAACADDGRQAIRLVREHAERFGVRADSIGMIGFSAGAFLAVDVALDPRAEPLAFVAPIYGGETRGVTVQHDAPPLFGAVARNDILVRIVEGLHADWSGAGRSSELHVFARGAHGFGMIRQGLPSDRWCEIFLAWLEDLSLPVD
jgi:acetyl esterase/lipase